jgi:hypothetical protein
MLLQRLLTFVLCTPAAADDSGSMAFEEGGERIDDLKMIGSKVRCWWWCRCCSDVAVVGVMKSRA